MAKMGISDVDSYRGAEVFEAIGLARRSRGVLPAHAGDRRPDRIRRARARCSRAVRGGALRGAGAGEPRVREISQGRRASCDEPRGRRRAQPGRGPQASLGGERHGLGRLRTVLAARQRARAARAARPARARPCRRAGSARGGRTRRVDSAPLERRHVPRLAFGRGARDRGDRLQPARRAFELGRGGEDPERFGDERNSRIKQIARPASASPRATRSPPTSFQIKIAQGSKPGEGGQLPAHKVSEEIARLRHTRPGISLSRRRRITTSTRSRSRAARLRPEAGEPGRGRLGQARLRGRRRPGRRRCRRRSRTSCTSQERMATGASPLSSIKNAGAPWGSGSPRRSGRSSRKACEAASASASTAA